MISDCGFRVADWVASAPLGNVSGEVLIAVIGAIFAGLTHLLGKRKGEEKGREQGRAEAMQIGPQPFMVELKDQFITRREFEKLESRLEVTTTEMKGLFQQTMQAVTTQAERTGKRIEAQNDRLSKKIEEVASGAYQGRQRLHATQNAQGERIAAMETNYDVGVQLGKLADAICPAVKTQPVHMAHH